MLGLENEDVNRNGLSVEQEIRMLEAGQKELAAVLPSGRSRRQNRLYLHRPQHTGQWCQTGRYDTDYRHPAQQQHAV